tara:strand:- start:16215 stop:17291 length:1077 start_codon:yes stop_codon:yes gene_type:complete
MDHADSLYLQRLCASLRPQLSLPFEEIAVPVDRDLANFAVHRHRVGPLLYKAAQHFPKIDNAADLILVQSYEKNLRAILMQKAASKRLTILLQSHSIPFSFLKGLGLANQIYSDPSTRQSKDIDILISPESSESAIRLFNESGYIFKSYSFKPNRPVRLSRQLWDIRQFKDLTFVDPKFATQIELHQRLFKAEPENFTSDLGASFKVETYPSITDCHYSLYFILHGALTLWSRLKWVVDLSLLVRAMPSPDRWQLVDLAKTYGCEAAVIASVQLADEMFPGSLDDEWLLILADRGNRKSVRKIFNLFYETLATSSAENSSLPNRQSTFFDVAPLIFGKQIAIPKLIWRRLLVSLSIRV